MQQIYENGINAENKGLHYLQIKNDFTLVIYYDSLIDKYRYIPFDRHVTVNFVKEHIENKLFKFLPLLFNTSFKNDIGFDILRCTIPSFVTNNGEDINA